MMSLKRIHSSQLIEFLHGEYGEILFKSQVISEIMEFPSGSLLMYEIDRCFLEYFCTLQHIPGLPFQYMLAKPNSLIDTNKSS